MNLNCKKHNSVLLLAAADAYYMFSYVKVGGCGKNCDLKLFQETEFCEQLCNKNLNNSKPNTFATKRY